MLTRHASLAPSTPGRLVVGFIKRSVQHTIVFCNTPESIEMACREIGKLTAIEGSGVDWPLATELLARVRDVARRDGERQRQQALKTGELRRRVLNRFYPKACKRPYWAKAIDPKVAESMIADFGVAIVPIEDPFGETCYPAATKRARLDPTQPTRYVRVAWSLLEEEQRRRVVAKIVAPAPKWRRGSLAAETRRQIEGAHGLPLAAEFLEIEFLL